MRGSGALSSPYHYTTWLRERGREGVAFPPLGVGWYLIFELIIGNRMKPSITTNVNTSHDKLIPYSIKAKVKRL